MIWPHHIPTRPPGPQQDAHSPIEPILTGQPVQSVGPDDSRKSPSGTQSPELVGAWMQSPVVTCLPDQNLGELMELLSVHHISGAPVVDEAGHLLGVVSQTDVAACLGGLYSEQARSGHGYHQGRLAYFNPSQTPVDPLLRQRTIREIFSTTVHFVSPRATLYQVIELMLKEHVHRLLVLDEGKLVGLISTLDVLRILRDQGLV